MLRARMIPIMVMLLLSACGTEAILPDARSSLEPTCANPAPLQGKYDPRAPGYIVVYRDGTPVRKMTIRLASKYGFMPKYIYEHALLGFAAELSDPAVAALRCEPVVKSISHDSAMKGGS